jgi:tRNA pseudouridine55 synthase
MGRKRVIINNGFMLINKPAGPTSHQVASTVGKEVKGRRGIEGILDPFASGLLVLAFGQETRFLQFFDPLLKAYEATIKLGQTTDTLDLEGIITEEKPVPELEKSILSDVALHFQGTIEQIPPVFSNLKVDGVRSHVLARKGTYPDLKPRNAMIDSIKLKQAAPDELLLQATVGRGCYIRSLARDIAKELGTVGHLTKLHRVAIGPLRCADALPPEGVTTEHLIDAGRLLEWVPELKLDLADIKSIIQGKKVNIHKLDGNYRLIYADCFFGIGQLRDNILHAFKLNPIDGDLISSLH